MNLPFLFSPEPVLAPLPIMNPGPSSTFDTVPIAPPNKEDVASWSDVRRVAGSFAQDKMDGSTAAIMDDPLQQDTNTQPVVPDVEPVLPQVCFSFLFLFFVPFKC